MRKQHTSAFKAKIVQEAIKEEKTIAQIASENGIGFNRPPSQNHLFSSLTSQISTIDLLRKSGRNHVPDSKTAVLRTKFSCLESAKHGTAERPQQEIHFAGLLQEV